MDNRNIMVVKEFTFDSAHYLPGYPGKCKNLHGHTYHLQVGVKGEIGSDGMVMDFAELKGTINTLVVNELDHKMLNEVTVNDFPSLRPTAENMVFWMASLISKHIPQLAFIRLYETPTSYAEWRAL